MTTTADRLAPGESGYIELLLISGARQRGGKYGD